jgi:sec-independent protein translocase protein TatA
MILAEILGPDLLVILVVVALLFGSSQLPKLARSLGSAKSEFERGIKEAGAAGTTQPSSEGRVTMTRAELDRLLGRGDDPSMPEANG